MEHEKMVQEFVEESNMITKRYFEEYISLMERYSEIVPEDQIILMKEMRDMDLVNVLDELPKKWNKCSSMPWILTKRSTYECRMNKLRETLNYIKKLAPEVHK